MFDGDSMQSKTFPTIYIIYILQEFKLKSHKKFQIKNKRIIRTHQVTIYRKIEKSFMHKSINRQINKEKKTSIKH